MTVEKNQDSKGGELEAYHDSTPTNDPVVRQKRQFALSHKRDAVKRAIAHHLGGLGGQSLAIKALEKLGAHIDSDDPQVSLAAIDKIVKLLPYVISRESEGMPGSLSTGGAPVNIQINFDQQMKERLQGTHFQGLMESLGLRQAPNGPA